MHEGHRKRMYEKLANGDTLYEHEILEMLLFSVLPRKNTNPLAHSLLNSFGSIAGVFGATVEELKTVKGVGPNVAYYLKLLALCSKTVNNDFGGITVLKHAKDYKDFIRLRLRGKLCEIVEIYCLDKSGRVKSIIPFTNNSVNHVEIEVKELTQAISAAGPHAVIASHNHLQDSCEPSANDDKFTRDLQAVCSMTGADLMDHCIYCATGEVYSYSLSGRMANIKRNYTLNNLVEQQMKIEIEEENKNKII